MKNVLEEMKTTNDSLVSKGQRNLKIHQWIFLGLAILCLVYAVIVRSVASGTFSFVLWIILALFFACLFAISKAGLWKKTPKKIRILFCAVMTLGVMIFLSCQVAILSSFFATGDPEADYIIVLGAQMKKNGPSGVYKHRLDAAYEYLLDNPNTICIVTGAKGSNETVSEAQGGKDYLVKKGIEASQIVTEEESTTTKENIENASQIINLFCNASSVYPPTKEEDLKVAIVTNNFHVFRGTHLAKELTPYEISGIAAYTNRLYLPNNMLRESLGILKDIRNLF